jgi:hypothetical protein
MKKKPINPEYLRSITKSGIRDTKISVYDLAFTLREFADEYLAGIMNLTLTGRSFGYVNLRLPVFSYMMRLLCEEAEDEPLECKVTIGDDFVMESTYPAINDLNLTRRLTYIAQYAGFNVKVCENKLVFTARIRISSIMQIYANSSNELMDWLFTTFKM